jgi:hypothetical protein
MHKIILAAIFILLIWTSNTLTRYQMRNVNAIDTQQMQRYVEYINTTNQLNSYNRR